MSKLSPMVLLSGALLLLGGTLATVVSLKQAPKATTYQCLVMATGAPSGAYTGVRELYRHSSNPNNGLVLRCNEPLGLVALNDTDMSRFVQGVVAGQTRVSLQHKSLGVFGSTWQASLATPQQPPPKGHL
jgi:hypothetical protein